jgi:type II secretory pathway pseudopilin PulG
VKRRRFSAEPRARHGFTLVEVLLVTALIIITTMISMPYLVKSIRGNRLRTAARTVVMAGRYARSMALLKQQEMLVRFDLDTATISVEPRYAPPPVADTQTVADAAATPGEAATADSTNVDERLLEPGEKVGIKRVLDGVRIDAVGIGDTAQPATKGTTRIIYRTNGRCMPYTVRIVDEQDHALLTAVDALSTATTKPDDK